LITTCSIAIPIPIEKRENKATSKPGNKAKRRAARKASKKPPIVTVFSEYFSIRIPEGIDITPYATKNEKGRNPARPMLRSKLSIMSGMSGPRILVRNEMTKKIKKIRRTIKIFLFMGLLFNQTIQTWS
jgi:hypothetical protein